MIEILEIHPDPVRVELRRHEARGLVEVIEALTEKVSSNAEILALIGISPETLALADLAGAKVLMRL